MTLPASERERIRAYLVEKAGTSSVEELIERVEAGMAELCAAAEAVPRDRFGERPPGEEWSPLDCLQHTVHWNSEVARAVLHAALTGEVVAGPIPAGALPPDDAGVPSEREALIEAMRQANVSLYEHVRAADPGSFLEVRWEHPFFGMLNWREWLLFLRLHALDHARQLTAMRDALRA
ncbi:DinB family protein [Tepidiforma sp.]|uniref:DinB family protein n=1 Tax=Tepidiforma sp. TaxID=2682230 RepID=UPI002ADD3DCB|nr:DinB family protein [Tepidiforma sp.]